MEKKKSKYRKRNIFLGVVLGIIVLTLLGLIYFLSPVSMNGKDVEFIVTEGESLREIGKSLEKEGLIKNDKFFLGYIVLKDAKKIYAAKYELNTGMTLSEIVEVLRDGGKNKDEITITFKEGLNMRGVAKVISKNTNNSYEEVLEYSQNEDYINELIKKYWFITKDIKNKDIYYPLEGYLFPDSYNFLSKDVTVKEIFDAMIDHLDHNLQKYKKQIEKSDYNAHEILTIASILELEGIDKNSRKDIAGVFYNRLGKKMILGSDVTSYYGVKKDLTSDISQSELNSVNGYNTRINSMAGKLPVGPISNPSLISIEAALNPNSHDYYYFVADKNGKIYLTKTYETHNKVIADLKNKGLWFEW